ncbi:MAG: HYR domain-containing protein [Candidatus Bathyarchaeota archaeon]|nr:HYR domain-containing protein [Candidatus Bathyarchaeota archaeon]
MSTSQPGSASRWSSHIAVAVLLIGLMLIAVIPQWSVAAEVPSTEWSKSFSGAANAVIQTADGGYAIAGYSLTYTGTGMGVRANALLIKTDPSGGFQWEKTYGTDVFLGIANAVAVAQTPDSGYVLFGESGVLVKTDADGNVQWSTPLGMSGAYAGVRASDGNYFVIGNQINSNGDQVAWLLKVNERGSVILNKTWTGGVVYRAVVETDDRGYALAGYWKNDFWFAKVDLNNNLQWAQTYSYGGVTDRHIVNAITKTKDGGYVLAGTGDWQASGGTVPWIIKIDSQGHEKWSLPYGQIPNNEFGAVLQTEDEGYLLALANSAMLLRTDSSGSDKWNMTYADTGGSASNYRASALIQTRDRGYVVVGTSSGNVIMLAKISPEPDVTPPVISVLSPKSKTYEPSEIPLTLTVNEPTSWIKYSLDGKDNVTITGNITLPTLSSGDHSITVYAQDIAGNVGTSGPIRFRVAAVFPIGWIAVGVAIAAGVVVGVLVYFKRQTLSARGKQGLKSYLKQHLTALGNNRMLRTLVIIGLCIMFVLVQLFFPFFYFSAFKSSSSGFEVGVTYVYEQDTVDQIYSEVMRIHDLGIRTIRVNLVCDSVDPNNYLNGMTDVFFSAAQNLGMRVALIIQNREDPNQIRYYLGRWGRYLSYVQILNEPESASSWDVGALFTDDEAISLFEKVYGIVEQYNLSAQLYTNFGAGFVVRSNLPIKFSENLDFVGLDVFMESFLVMSPTFIQLLHEITNKDVVITEFGMSASDDVAQSNYIISGLDLFKSMGLRGCWIVYWNSQADYYGIRGRLAEQRIGEWIAENT